jgi:tRNA (guanine-N7-)-methyltransferase
MAKVFKNYPGIALNPADLDGSTDFVHIFGRNQPVHIEIGSGKGTFLLNEAQAFPDVNFLGIEWASKYYRHAVDRIGRWGLSNVRLIRTDATAFLRDSMPNESVDCFHVYFPDPWPKKRHHKRRFMCNSNIEQILRILKTSGLLRIATDHAGYFEQIEAVLNAYAARLEATEFLPAAGAKTGEWVGTNFERKYLKEKRPVFCVSTIKRC